jgi:hypothetical protein
MQVHMREHDVLVVYLLALIMRLYEAPTVAEANSCDVDDYVDCSLAYLSLMTTVTLTS